MYTESVRIAERYERRKQNAIANKNSLNYCYDHYAQMERAKVYHQIVKKRFNNADKITLMEIGAGTGVNLTMFKEMGLNWSNIHANELLDDRVEVLKEKFHGITVYPGDILDLNTSAQFDIVLISTVFSSILDMAYRQKVALKAWSLAKTGGIIICYDFIYNNPRNKDVRGVPPSDFKRLFPMEAQLIFRSVTLAPPIGRITGKLYSLFNALHFLRTHTIVEIKKES